VIDATNSHDATPFAFFNPQMQAWQQNPQTRHFVLSVNVSAKQFHQADFSAQN